MRSKIFRPTILGLLVLLLVAGSAPMLASADDPGLEPRALTGPSDLVAYGNAWVPEMRNHFAQWKWFGWGMQAKLKAARAPGYEWVHIPIPYISAWDGTATDLDLVQFCMRSTNGAATRPVQVDLWSDQGNHATRFYTGAVTWTANNNKQCITVDVANAWHESLGLSVRIYFANGDDIMYLYKAWARVRP